ncbi:12438_t:CDS:2, partial [Gigaspora margarita]
MINPTCQMAYYIMILQGYNFVVKHRSGKQLSHVDDSNKYQQLVEYLIHSRVSKTLTKEQIRKFKIRANSYLVKENILYRKPYHELTRPLRVIKLEEIEIVLKSMHKDPTSFVKGCNICQRRGKPRAHEPLNSVIVGQPFKHISINFVGPLPLTKQGNKFLIVAAEYLTKWLKTRAIPNCTAETAVSFLYDNIICRHGCPHELITDHGSHFDNGLINTICKRLGIKHIMSSPYYLQANGLVERYNRTLCETIAKCMSQYGDDRKVTLSAELFILSYPSEPIRADQ